MESKPISHTITLWVFYSSTTASTLLAQCDTTKYVQNRKSQNLPTDYTGAENHLNDGFTFNPRFSQPPLYSISPPPPLLFCVNSPPPPPDCNGPKPKRPKFAVWCVAKPTVPGPVLQEALDYACGSGADCGAIQINGPCFQPNTVLAHASYAFNSYFQSTKLAGGTCDFGGKAMLVTDDPSFDGCLFLLT